MFFDEDERLQLCDLLDEIGPDAATLLDPWTTRDIAAHLVLREHDPFAAPGLVIPGAWARFAERQRAELKNEAVFRTRFDDSIPATALLPTGMGAALSEPQ